MKRFLKKLCEATVGLNHKNILSLLEINPKANFLDLGCDDGTYTKKWQNKLGPIRYMELKLLKKELFSPKKMARK